MADGQTIRVDILVTFETRGEADAALRLFEPSERVANQLPDGRWSWIIVNGAAFPRWRTVGDAARALGVSPQSVSNSITGRYPIVKGMRFERVFTATQDEGIPRR